MEAGLPSNIRPDIALLLRSSQQPHSPIGVTHFIKNARVCCPSGYKKGGREHSLCIHNPEYHMPLAFFFTPGWGSNLRPRWQNPQIHPGWTILPTRVDYCSNTVVSDIRIMTSGPWACNLTNIAYVTWILGTNQREVARCHAQPTLALPNSNVFSLTSLSLLSAVYNFDDTRSV